VGSADAPGFPFPRLSSPGQSTPLGGRADGRIILRLLIDGGSGHSIPSNVPPKTPTVPSPPRTFHFAPRKIAQQGFVGHPHILRSMPLVDGPKGSCYRKEVSPKLNSSREVWTSRAQAQDAQENNEEAIPAAARSWQQAPPALTRDTNNPIYFSLTGVPADLVRHRQAA
jgi:hypothetical protein